MPVKDSVITMHNENTTENLIKIIDAILQLDLSKIEWIKFGGGEPLLSTSHLHFLTKLSEKIDTSNVTVNYTSNYTVIPKHNVFDIWKKYKKIELSGSIDGVYDQFYFFRWPFKFEKLQNNIKVLYDNCPDNVEFKIEHTVNPLNLYYYDELEKFLLEKFPSNKFGVPNYINIHPCWGHLGLESVNQKVLNLTKDKLGSDHKVVKLAEQVCDSTELNTKYLDNLDQMRQTNWREIFPDIEKYYV